MSVETILYVIMGLLVLILVLQIYNMILQKSAVEALTEANDETARKKKAKNHDLGDLLDERMYEKALKLAELRLKADPDDPGLHWYHAVSSYYLGKWVDSKASFEEALTREPTFKKGTESYMEVIDEKIGVNDT
jgi:tetratricopeptide (TPR) repeat protein